jgi:LPS export ABC transporter protein LptC
MKQFIYVALAVLAGLGVLYSIVTGRSDDGVEQEAGREQRGYYLVDARMIEMGPTGRPRLRIEAKQIEQQLSDQSVTLELLKLDYSTDDAAAWTVTANRGRLAPGREALHLNGDVTLRGGDERGTAVVRTEQLDYDTDSNRVDTSEPVKIEFGAHAIAARGLRADLNAGTLRLESDIHGRFER